jgi:hypothetical protein
VGWRAIEEEEEEEEGRNSTSCCNSPLFVKLSLRFEIAARY